MSASNDGRYKLNAYSSTPDQLEAWITAFQSGPRSCSAMTSARRPRTAERQTLTELKRGVYVRRGVKARARRSSARDVFFAMPVQDGQLVSGHWRTGLVADRTTPATRRCRRASRGQGFERRAARLSDHAAGARHAEQGQYRHQRGCRDRDVAPLRVAPLPRIWRGDRHLHQPLICQEAGDPAAAPEASLSLPQAEGGDLPAPRRRSRDRQGWRPHLDAGRRHLSRRAQISGTSSTRSTAASSRKISTTHHNNDSFYEDPQIAVSTASHRKTKVDNWARLFPLPARAVIPS